MAQPTQMLPDYLTYVTRTITRADGVVQTSITISEVPITYYGPSIPLGTNGVWTYGGSVSPTAVSPTNVASSSNVQMSSMNAPSSSIPNPEPPIPSPASTSSRQTPTPRGSGGTGPSQSSPPESQSQTTAGNPSSAIPSNPPIASPSTSSAVVATTPGQSPASSSSGSNEASSSLSGSANPTLSSSLSESTAAIPSSSSFSNSSPSLTTSRTDTLTSSFSSSTGTESSTSSSTSTLTPVAQNFSSSLSKGAIAGIVIGSVAGFILLLLLLLCCARYFQRRRRANDTAWSGWAFVGDDGAPDPYAPEGRQETAPLNPSAEPVAGGAAAAHTQRNIAPESQGLLHSRPEMDEVAAASAIGIGAGAGVLASSGDDGSSPDSSEPNGSKGTSSSTAVSDYGLLLSGGLGHSSSPLPHGTRPVSYSDMPARPSSELRGTYIPEAVAVGGAAGGLADLPEADEASSHHQSSQQHSSSHQHSSSQQHSQESSLEPPPPIRDATGAAVLGAFAGRSRPRREGSPSPVDPDEDVQVMTAQRVPMRASQIQMTRSNLGASPPGAPAAPSTHSSRSDRSDERQAGWGSLAAGGIARLTRFTWFRNMRENLGPVSDRSTSPPPRSMEEVPRNRDSTFIGRVMTEYDVEAGRALLAINYKRSPENEKLGRPLTQISEDNESLYDDMPDAIPVTLTSLFSKGSIMAPGYAYAPLHHKQQSSLTTLDSLDNPVPPSQMYLDGRTHSGPLHPPGVNLISPDLRLPSPVQWESQHQPDVLEVEPPPPVWRDTEDGGSFGISPPPSTFHHARATSGSIATTHYQDASQSSRPSRYNQDASFGSLSLYEDAASQLPPLPLADQISLYGSQRTKSSKSSKSASSRIRHQSGRVTGVDFLSDVP